MDIKKNINVLYSVILETVSRAMAIYKNNKWLKMALKVVFISAALWFVFTSIPINEIKTTLSDANLLYLIPAALSFAVSKAIAAFRTNIFLRGVKIIVSELVNLKLYLLGMFYNFFLPGGIGGDGYKLFWLHKNKGCSTKQTFKALLTDRLSGVTALIWLIVLLSILVNVPFNIRIVTIACSTIMGIALVVGIRIYYKGLISTSIKTLLLSFFVQSFQVLSAWFLLLSLNTSEQPLSYLLIFLISSVAAMLPFSIGGLGARELAFLFGAKILVLNETVSVSLSIAFYFISLIVSFPGIYFMFNPKALGSSSSPVSEKELNEDTLTQKQNA